MRNSVGLRIDDSVRCTPSGEYSIEDLITVQAKLDDWKSVWIDRLSIYPELLLKLKVVVFPGEEEPSLCMKDIESAYYLMGILPGLVGGMYRDAMDSICQRVQEGDLGLAEDILSRTTDVEELNRVIDVIDRMQW